MTESATRKQGFGLLRIAVAGCVACCAGPIVALLGGLSIAGLASTLVIGTVGIVVAVVAAVTALAFHRRRRRRRECGVDEPVALATPTRRP